MRRFQLQIEDWRDALASLESLVIAGAPVLLRNPPQGRVKAPLIILLHGFGPPGSEQALADALPLDDVPAYKAYVGLPLFGARMPAGGMAEVGRGQAEDCVLKVYLPVAEGVLRDVSGVVDKLRERLPVTLEAGIGLFGFSGGGVAAQLALIESQVPISAAVLCGAPKNLSASVAAVERAIKIKYAWTEEARAVVRRLDPVIRAAEIARRETPPAILLLLGDRDEYFSVEDAQELHDALASAYHSAGVKHRVSLQILPGMTHCFAAAAGSAGAVCLSDASPVRAAAAAWFTKYLKG
jgi:dienelactone hydrolase